MRNTLFTMTLLFILIPLMYFYGEFKEYMSEESFLREEVGYWELYSKEKIVEKELAHYDLYVFQQEVAKVLPHTFEEKNNEEGYPQRSLASVSQSFDSRKYDVIKDKLLLKEEKVFLKRKNMRRRIVFLSHLKRNLVILFGFLRPIFLWLNLNFI